MKITLNALIYVTYCCHGDEDKMAAMICVTGCSQGDEGNNEINNFFHIVQLL